jgi:3-(3-hydroxy-phenyl)propionate hydroxylase
MEVLEPTGITKKLLEIGIVVPAWQLRDRRDGVVGTFELASLLKDETPYPYRLHLEQHRYTPLVYDMLRDIPHVDVKFSARVTNVTQDADGVKVTAETPNGTETFEGKWVIGSDGGGSVVRKSADIDLEGLVCSFSFT